MPLRTFIASVFASALVLGAAAPALAEAPPLSAHEFKLWKDYVFALEDERVQKLPEKKRLGAIAKNFRVKEKELQSAVEKGQQYGAAVAKIGEADVRALLDVSALKGRVKELKVDDTVSHVVTYVAWTNTNSDKLEEEACLAALLAAKGAPVTSTVAVWAVNPAGRKVFEAKISAASASRFMEARLGMFAATRYIRQFEDVKNAYKGTPPDDTKPAAATAPAPTSN